MPSLNDDMMAMNSSSIEERIARLERMTGGGSFEVVRGASGTHFRVDKSEEIFPAKVTAYNASTGGYAWKEQIILADGTRADPDDNMRSGLYNSCPAYEINGVVIATFPVQVFMRHRIENGPYGVSYEFEAPCGTCGESTTPPPAPPPPPSGGGGGDGNYECVWIYICVYGRGRWMFAAKQYFNPNTVPYITTWEQYVSTFGSGTFNCGMNARPPCFYTEGQPWGGGGYFDPRDYGTPIPNACSYPTDPCTSGITPGPGPTPSPTPGTTPGPIPSPSPTPQPTPSPLPWPSPTPYPYPDPTPLPYPKPTPGGYPGVVPTPLMTQGGGASGGSDSMDVTIGLIQSTADAVAGAAASPSIIQPGNISSQQNNYAPGTMSGVVTIISVSTDGLGDEHITGFSMGQQNGQILLFHNATGTDNIILDGASSSSAVGNRILRNPTGLAGNITVGPGASIMLYYLSPYFYHLV